MKAFHSFSPVLRHAKKAFIQGANLVFLVVNNLHCTVREAIRDTLLCLYFFWCNSGALTRSKELVHINDATFILARPFPCYVFCLRNFFLHLLAPGKQKHEINLPAWLGGGGGGGGREGVGAYACVW